jgi:hypothetical protein
LVVGTGKDGRDERLEERHEGWKVIIFYNICICTRTCIPMFVNSVADPGCSSIPDLGSQIPDPTTAKKEGENIGCPTFFCSHKYHKIVNYFFFEQVKKKIEPIY